jgi:hypothetical protein
MYEKLCGKINDLCERRSEDRVAYLEEVNKMPRAAVLHATTPPWLTF